MVPLMAESLNLPLGKDLKSISGLEGVADPPPPRLWDNIQDSSGKEATSFWKLRYRWSTLTRGLSGPRNRGYNLLFP